MDDKERKGLLKLAKKFNVSVLTMAQRRKIKDESFEYNGQLLVKTSIDIVSLVAKELKDKSSNLDDVLARVADQLHIMMCLGYEIGMYDLFKVKKDKK